MIGIGHPGEGVVVARVAREHGSERGGGQRRGRGFVGYGYGIGIGIGGDADVDTSRRWNLYSLPAFGRIVFFFKRADSSVGV